MTTNLIDRKRGPVPGSQSPRQALVTARAAWGAQLPEWLETLAEACDRTSQNDVAKKLSYSGSVISQVLKNGYRGSLDSVEKAVRGALMAEELDCPVIGLLSKKLCIDNQKKAEKGFFPSSSLRVRLYQNCKGGCLHSRLTRKEST